MRSKKALIENFIKGINEVDDVLDEWRSYVAEEKEKAIKTIIETENLKESETRKFISTAFETGSIKTTGTDVDKILPPISRFGSGNRDEKRKSVLDRLIEFFERFFGIG